MAHQAPQMSHGERIFSIIGSGASVLSLLGVSALLQGFTINVMVYVYLLALFGVGLLAYLLTSNIVNVNLSPIAQTLVSAAAAVGFFFFGLAVSASLNDLKAEFLRLLFKTSNSAIMISIFVYIVVWIALAAYLLIFSQKLRFQVASFILAFWIVDILSGMSCTSSSDPCGIMR